MFKIIGKVFLIDNILSFFIQSVSLRSELLEMALLE